jgi:hypothetical protein
MRILKRVLLACALVLFIPSLLKAQADALVFQSDTVIHSVAGRLVWSGLGYQNHSLTRSLRIKDMYFAHQADSIFIVDTKFNVLDFVLPPWSFSSASFRFLSPKNDTTIYDTLVVQCAYKDDPGNVFFLRRPYVGFTTSDSSSDSDRQCLYGHDYISLREVNFGDTAFGILCFEQEFISHATVSITNIEFVGQDAESFHLIDSTFPKVETSGRISAPYYFSPARQTGLHRYLATAVAQVTSTDGILCHESDIELRGFLPGNEQDTIYTDLYGTDSLDLHFSVDSTLFWHVLAFKNNSGGGIKIDTAYLSPGTCFGLDFNWPYYRTRIEANGMEFMGVHYRGDSTSANYDCSDTLYIVAENAVKILSFTLQQGKIQVHSEVTPVPNKALELEIYPNPAFGEVTIESTVGRRATIEIFDVLGNRVASHAGGVWKWSAEDDGRSLLPAGSYIVRLNHDGRVVSKYLRILR